MVHALEESWRILKPRGVFIDLRPLSTDPPIEILSDAGCEPAGQVDDSPDKADDRAADDAVERVVKRGLFQRNETTRFNFSFYWNSVGEMQAYAEERWSDSTKLPSAVLERARQLEKMAADRVQVRVTREMHLATYAKREVGSGNNLGDQS